MPAGAPRADLTWMPRASTLVEAGAQYEGIRGRRIIHQYGLAPDNRTPLLHSASNQTAVSPWLQANLSIGRAFSLKGGAGVYHQFPELSQTHGPHARTGLRSERARHTDVGLEHQLTPSTRWQVMLYHRKDAGFLRLADSDFRLVNGRLIEPSDTGQWYNGLTGTSYGAELLVQRSSALGLSGWMSYSVGRTRYLDNATGERFDGDFDQRHTVNTFLQYAISSRANVSGKLRVGSNFPMPGYWEARNGGVFLGDRLNDVRVPTYARLDLLVNRVFNYTKRRLTLFAEVMNVLNRDNARFTTPNINVQVNRSLNPNGTVRTEIGRAEATDYLQSLFPRMPSAGILFEF